MNDYDLYDEAINLWIAGLMLPDSELTGEDKLRFQMNLGLISQEEAYHAAMQQSFCYIAEIALTNLITRSINDFDKETALQYLQMFKENFKTGRYYSLLFAYKGRFVVDDLVTQLKQDFELAYGALLEEGEITVALHLLTRYYSAIASQNMGNHELLQELIAKSEQLFPYGEKRLLADIYYCIANMALTIDETSAANSYHRKCFELTELCHSMRVYEHDQYYELLSLLYHQKSLLVSGEDSVKASKLALASIEHLQDQYKKTDIKGYIYCGLCSFYMRSHYKSASKYGKLAIECGNQINNRQILARATTYLAVADAKHHKRADAVQKFRTAYHLHKQIHESPQYLFSVLKECGIGIAQITE